LGIDPISLLASSMQHIVRKLSTRAITLLKILILVGGLHKKLWGPKVAGFPTLGISRLPFGSPGTKCHLDVSLVERHKVYYKGEGGGFPQIQVMVSLVNPSLPKSVATMH